jgi:hypothetical protein
VLAAAIVLPGSIYAASYGPNFHQGVTTGAYACVVHRAAGLQGDMNKGQRYAGSIKLKDANAHFTLTIKKRTDDAESKSCASAHPMPKPNEGFRSGYPYLSDFDNWFTCKTDYVLQMSPTKYKGELRGDDLYAFADKTMWHNFHIFDELNFDYSYNNEGNLYIEEGECQKM